MVSAVRSPWARFFAPGLLSIIVAYAAMSLIWGTTWLGIKFALTGFPPVTGSGIRFLIAGAVLYAIAFATRVDLRRHAPPLHLVLVLALTMFGINYALTYIAETHLASGLVAVLFGTMPFFIYALAHVMVNERITRRTIAGALLAFGGVAAISLTGDIRGGLPFVLAALVASASSGYANVYLKRFADGEPLATLPPAMLVAGVGLTVGGLLTEHTDLHRALALEPLLALGYLAVFGSSIAFYLNHWLLQRIDSGIVGLSALIIPVIAVTVGAFFGHEIFGVRDIVGALLVLAGISLALAPREQRVPQVVAD
jgi:drug/metabolite transporter (DMT)-like permease